MVGATAFFVPGKSADCARSLVQAPLQTEFAAVIRCIGGSAVQRFSGSERRIGRAAHQRIGAAATICIYYMYVKSFQNII